jgi:hypothetical protein
MLRDVPCRAEAVAQFPGVMMSRETARYESDGSEAMTLSQFDVRGEGITDDETEEIIRKGDPSRSLIRYRSDGSEVYIHTRVNMALLRAAVSLPILRLKPASREDELMPNDPLLTPEGSRRNYGLLERICEDLVSANCAACYIAEQHGEGRRDFYFATEDVVGFEKIARTAAEAFGFPLTFEQHSLGALAPLILITEAIGELGLEIAPEARIRTTRFEFWGAESSIVKLRAELESRGYRCLSLDPYLHELRMLKDVPIDGAEFRAVLREIVPLARSLRCSYRGTETVEHVGQLGLSQPLPERYAGESGPRTSVFRRIFGRKGS